MCICYIYTIQMISYNLVYSICVCSITYTVIHLHFCWRTSATHNLVGNLQVLPASWRVLWWSPKGIRKKRQVIFPKRSLLEGYDSWLLLMGGSWHRYIARHSAWCCRGNSWHGSRFRHRGGGVGKSKSCWKCHLTWIHSLKLTNVPVKRD